MELILIPLIRFPFEELLLLQGVSLLPPLSERMFTLASCSERAKTADVPDVGPERSESEDPQFSTAFSFIRFIHSTSFIQENDSHRPSSLLFSWVQGWIYSARVCPEERLLGNHLAIGGGQSKCLNLLPPDC